jgi:hypothetical protein
VGHVAGDLAVEDGEHFQEKEEQVKDYGVAHDFGQAFNGPAAGIEFG